MRDILALRDEARAAGLSNRVIIEPDPLYTTWPGPIEHSAIERYTGPRCGRCDNLVTIADRGGICRDCRRGGIS